MNNRYFGWTLLIAACGLQAYLVARGCALFLELDAVLLPLWLKSFSSYLLSLYGRLPYYYPIYIIVVSVLTTILSWVLLVLRTTFGWNLAFVVDLYFALPSLTLASILRYHHSKLQDSPEVVLFILALLHILILCSPPIRTLIFSNRTSPYSKNDFILPITSAR